MAPAHGHECQQQRSRVLYYYTVGRPRVECMDKQCPIYAPPEGEGQKMSPSQHTLDAAEGTGGGLWNASSTHPRASGDSLYCPREDKEIVE